MINYDVIGRGVKGHLEHEDDVKVVGFHFPPLLHGRGLGPLEILGHLEGEGGGEERGERG